MNILENNLEELNNFELAEITAGGLLYDLGAAAHRAFNAIANADFGPYGRMHSAG